MPRVSSQDSYLLLPGGDVSGVVVVGRQLVGKPVVQLLAQYTFLQAGSGLTSKYIGDMHIAQAHGSIVIMMPVEMNC